MLQREELLRASPILNIYIRSVPPDDCSGLVTQRSSAIEKPAKDPVATANAAFDLEGLAGLCRFLKYVQNARQVIRMFRNLPAPIQGFFCGKTCICGPLLIEKIDGTIRQHGPSDYRNCIDDRLKRVFEWLRSLQL